MSADLSKEEIVRCGQDWYDRQIKAKVEGEYKGRFLVVDVLSGEYEIADNAAAASNSLRARCPKAVLYGVRIGFPAAYRMGFRFTYGKLSFD